MPCDYRILQSPTKEQILFVLLETVGRSHLMSAVGTTLFHSPGWNEGKARYETLGKQGHKIKSSFRSGTYSVSMGFAFWLCRPFGAHKCGSMIYPGLAPWAVQEYRPYRAHPCFCYPSIILLFWCACLASLFRMVSVGTKIFFFGKYCIFQNK